MLEINKEFLKQFTKEELMECILSVGCLCLYDPRFILWRIRSDKIHKKNEELSKEIKILIKKMEGKNLIEQILISKQIDDLYKKQDKNVEIIEKMYNEVNV